MTNEQIQHFLEAQNSGKSPVKISFKTRPNLEGLFIQASDFNYLKSKNLWRIVVGAKIQMYSESKDESLARIFNGTEITRLSV